MATSSARTRVLTEELLCARLSNQKARLAECLDSGRAECLSYDIESTRDELVRVRAGERLIEYFDAAIGRWQLA